MPDDRHYKQLIDAMPQMVWTADAAGRIDFYNKRWLHYTDLKTTPAHASEWDIFVHPDDLQSWVDGWQHAVDSGDPFEFECRLRCAATGSYRWHFCQSVPLRNAQGTRVDGWLGTATDIHARKEVYREAIDQQASTNTVVRNANMVLWNIDCDGIFTYSEGLGLSLIGIKPGERVGKSIYELYKTHPDLLADVRAALAGERRQSRVKSGAHWFEVMYCPVRDANDKLIGVAGASFDITARVQAEQVARELQQRLTTVIDHAPIVLWSIDKNGIYTLLQGRVIQTSGLDPAKLLGTSIFERYKNNAEVVMHLRRALAGESFETEQLNPEGRTVSTRFFPIRDEANDISGVVGLAIDMTESKRLQEEQTNLLIEKKASSALKQSEAKLKEANVALSASAEAKSQFLANMSHEIRTPINGVIGATGLLLDTALDGEQKELAETILGSANVLLVLVNDILDFSKIEAGHMALELVDFNFANLLSDVEKSLRVEASKKGLKIRISINDELPTPIIRTDSTRLRQILTNLVGNAIKFTAAGHVDISVYLLGSEDDKIQLQIEVTDTGVGISESARDRLFKVFSQADASTTRRYGGTGLGLSICKHLVALLGGQIGVVSVEGQGSTFWFTIAVESGNAATLAANADGEKTVRPAARHVRVLLAEDNLVNQKIAVTMLQKCGYDVDVACNGRQALDALQKTRYDLVLMDCQMPEMDGYEATSHIRNSPESYRTIPIIAMTANAMSGDREKCLRAGMTDYIAKPIRLNYLKDVIEKVIQACQNAS